MEKVGKKVLSFGIILFWLFMLLLLYQKHYGPLWKSKTHGSFSGNEVFLADKERWMGIYLKGEKIGYTHLLEKKEAEGYSLKEKVSMRLKVMGTTQKIDTVTEANLGPD